MNRVEIRSAWDTLRFEQRHDPIAVNLWRKTHHIDKPTDARGSKRDTGCRNTLYLVQPLVIPARHALPLCKQFLNPAHLRNAEGCTHFVEPVVVAKPAVIQPRIKDVASLIPQAA